MTDRLDNNRRTMNNARMAATAVNAMLHPKTDTSPALRVLEDTVLALLASEEVVTCRYGISEDESTDTQRVEFVGITAGGVVDASFSVSDHKPGPVNATMRRWKHARAWGFVESVGYLQGPLSPKDDHPDHTTLTVTFADDDRPLKLKTGTPHGTLKFTYDELVGLLKYVSGITHD